MPASGPPPAPAPPSDPPCGQPPAALLPARLLVPWTLGVVLAVVLGVGLSVQDTQYPTPLALPNAYRLLVGVELFLLLTAAPLANGCRSAGPGVGLAQLALLQLLAAPAAVVAAWVADAELASVAASQGWLLLLAALVAGYLRADRGGRLRGLWWLAVGTLGGGAPIAAFHLGDLFRLPLGWLFALSPFWVADRLCHPWRFDWRWAVPAAVAALLAVALHAAARVGSPRPAPRR